MYFNLAGECMYISKLTRSRSAPASRQLRPRAYKGCCYRSHLTFVARVTCCGAGQLDLLVTMLFAMCVLTLISNGGGATKPSGIEQFWTDDYKIFEHVYGKTSDKHIYGGSLPPSVTLGVAKRNQATEKKEKYLQTFDLDADPSNNFDFGNNYKRLLPKSPSKKVKVSGPKKAQQPAISSVNFVSLPDSKPISQTSDPETYNYLRHLEDLNEKAKVEYPKGDGGFKPYLNYVGSDPEDSDAYKHIQDILDTHEANKDSPQKNNNDNVKYLAYDKSKPRKPYGVSNEVHNHKARCSGGRCRKRAAVSVRRRVRPYVRRVKNRLVSY